MAARVAPPRLVRWIAPAGAALGLAIGAFYLAAWVLGLPPRWAASGAITMKTNMALGQVLAGGALLLLGAGRSATRRRRGVAIAASALVLAIGAATLMTARHRAEEQLREADRRKAEFLAVLSHELRNTLAAVRNSLHVLHHAPAGSEPSARARAVIDRQVAQLSRLVEDLHLAKPFQLDELAELLASAVARPRARRILVIDDSDGLRANIREILDDEGWDVREARTVDEAVRVVREFEPGVILLDYRLPDVDGGEFLRRLGPLSAAPSVVLMTASTQVRELALAHGLRFYVPKPFRGDDLLDTVEHARAGA